MNFKELSWEQLLQGLLRTGVIRRVDQPKYDYEITEWGLRLIGQITFKKEEKEENG